MDMHFDNVGESNLSASAGLSSLFGLIDENRTKHTERILDYMQSSAARSCLVRLPEVHFLGATIRVHRVHRMTNRPCPGCLVRPFVVVSLKRGVKMLVFEAFCPGVLRGFAPDTMYSIPGTNRDFTRLKADICFSVCGFQLSCTLALGKRDLTSGASFVTRVAMAGCN